MMRKVFDFHIHVGHFPDWTKAARKFWLDTGPYVERLFAPDGYFNIAAMKEILDAEGVIGGVLLPEYAPETAALVPVERVVEISSKLPGMIPFGALNPHMHADPAAEFERQLALGVKGLKIHGVHCLHRVNDPRLYPAYEICRDRGLPLMLHAGTSIFPGVRLRYADPYDYDDVAVDFPELKVVLCHGGRGFWYQLAEFMVQRHERVWIDLSGLPPKNLLRYYPKLEKLSHRFVFGTDFPGVPGIAVNAAAIAALGLSAEAQERIFWKNASQLLPGLVAG